MIVLAQKMCPRELNERAVRLVLEARKEDPDLSVAAEVNREHCPGVNADRSEQFAQTGWDR